MYSCIIFLLTEGTARILLYSHNREMSIEVHVASKKSNEDPQILPAVDASNSRSALPLTIDELIIKNCLINFFDQLIEPKFLQCDIRHVVKIRAFVLLVLY